MKIERVPIHRFQTAAAHRYLAEQVPGERVDTYRVETARWKVDCCGEGAPLFSMIYRASIEVVHAPQDYNVYVVAHHTYENGGVIDGLRVPEEMTYEQIWGCPCELCARSTSTLEDVVKRGFKKALFFNGLERVIRKREYIVILDEEKEASRGR